MLAPGLKSTVHCDREGMNEAAMSPCQGAETDEASLSPLSPPVSQDPAHQVTQPHLDGVFPPQPDLTPLTDTPSVFSAQ